LHVSPGPDPTISQSRLCALPVPELESLIPHVRSKLIVTSVLAAALLIGTVAPAGATPSVHGDQVSEARQAIEGLRPDATVMVVQGADVTAGGNEELTVDTTAGTVVRLPASGAGEVDIRSSTGESFSFTIPGESSAQVTSIGDSNAVVYPSPEGASSTVIASSNGAVQVLTTLPDSSSPSAFSYEFGAPEGTKLQLDPETGAVIALNAGTLVFAIAPPWAVDAVGTHVPTRFALSGSTVTQVVDHTAGNYVYPIVADPTVNSSMIASYKWVKGSKGYTISVAVTPWMGWVTITAAAADGWSELTRAVKSNSATEYKRLNTEAMRQQWNCHAAGKAVIGIAGWLGIDGRPTWDLETWRKTASNPIDLVTKMCNW
jgi:hypothetical protein